MAPENANSCICNRILGSFRINNIFFAFPAQFPAFCEPITNPLRELAASALHKTTKIGYHISIHVSRGNMQESSIQARLRLTV